MKKWSKTIVCVVSELGKIKRQKDLNSENMLREIFKEFLFELVNRSFEASIL